MVIEPADQWPTSSAPPVRRGDGAKPERVLIDTDQVLAKIPISTVSLWSWCRAGEFPLPLDHFPNKRTWDKAVVDAWMRARPIRKYKPLPGATSANDAPWQQYVEAPKELVFLSKKQVIKKILATGPTLWKWIRQGKFPPGRVLSPDITVWFEHEVAAYLRSLRLREYPRKKS
jgi:predicted DNA-binding transcriptional regulator AlpA